MMSSVFIEIIEISFTDINQVLEGGHVCQKAQTAVNTHDTQSAVIRR